MLLKRVSYSFTIKMNTPLLKMSGSGIWIKIVTRNLQILLLTEHLGRLNLNALLKDSLTNPNTDPDSATYIVERLKIFQWVKSYYKNVNICFKWIYLSFSPLPLASLLF